MGRAGKKLDIAAFTITYNPMRNLIKKLTEQGVVVRIVTENSKVQDVGSDIPFLADLEGITVKEDRDGTLMHHKFIVIDNVTVLNGSVNFARTGVWILIWRMLW